MSEPSPRSAPTPPHSGAHPGGPPPGWAPGPARVPGPPAWQPGPSPGSAPPWAWQRPTNTKAILSVALLAIPPAALVFGVLARQEIKRTGEAGWGLATAGLWISVAYLGLMALGLVAYVAVVASILIVGGTSSGVSGP